MTKIKELNVFTHGDSAQVRTWSNIPYLFTTTLERQGIKINRININPNKWTEKIFNRCIWPVIRRLTRKDDFYQYNRTWWYQVEAENKIKRACKRYSNADAHLFISMSFSAAHCSNKPSILFGDWTISYYFEYFLRKTPGRLERAAIARQDHHMQNATLVICLFPGITDYLKRYYKNINVRYIGNVINNLKGIPTEDLVDLKSVSRQILFVGSKRYREGAKQLIEAFIQFKMINPHTELHIIGMTKADLGTNDQQIFAYGYLDKGEPAECELYYKLLSQATVFVNTTDKWGAFSSMVEAMFYFTPIITTAYYEFVKTFGRTIEFGWYFNQDSDNLFDLLSEAFTVSPNYRNQCVAAHQTVKNFTWDSYVKKFITAVEEL